MKTRKQILMLLLVMLAGIPDSFGTDQEGEEGTEERSCQTADRIRRLQDRRQHCYAHARTFYTSDFTILTANQK